MERNMFHRVEIAFPILEKKARKRIMRELGIYLADNTQAWMLHADGSYERLQPGDSAPVSAQTTLLESLAET
jgi:polyphosphate kinase